MVAGAGTVGALPEADAARLGAVALAARHSVISAMRQPALLLCWGLEDVFMSDRSSFLDEFLPDAA